jgi:hypothetical protein
MQQGNESWTGVYPPFSTGNCVFKRGAVVRVCGENLQDEVLEINQNKDKLLSKSKKKKVNLSP